MMRVVILSKGSMLINLIKGVQDAGSEVVGVLRYEKVLLNKFRLFFNDFFKNKPDLTFIKKFHIPEIDVNSANSDKFRNYLINNNIDILIVATWSERISKEIFDIPKIASVNLHPSLLPKYRGANPYFSAIKNGDKKSGFTFHLLNERFDAGAILSQKEIPILEGETAFELRNKIVVESRNEVAKLLQSLEFGAIIPKKQDESQVSYCEKITCQQFMLDFVNLTADEVLATVRGLHPWTPAYISVGNNFFMVNPYNVFKVNSEKAVLAGKIVDKDLYKKSLTIACADGQLFVAENLTVYGFFKKYFTKFYLKQIKI